MYAATLAALHFFYSARNVSYLPMMNGCESGIKKGFGLAATNYRATMPELSTSLFPVGNPVSVYDSNIKTDSYA